MIRSIITILLFSALLGCGEVDRQSLLQQRVDELVAAINDHDAGEAMSFFASNATWRPGWDSQRVKQTLFVYFRRFPTVKVSLNSEAYRWISDNEAVLSATVYTLGVSGARLDVSGNRYQIEVRWFFNDGEWQITRFDWQ